jgi:hypothetical protein
MSRSKEYLQSEIALAGVTLLGAGSAAAALTIAAPGDRRLWLRSAERQNYNCLYWSGRSGHAGNDGFPEAAGYQSLLCDVNKSNDYVSGGQAAARKNNARLGSTYSDWGHDWKEPRQA